MRSIATCLFTLSSLTLSQFAPAPQPPFSPQPPPFTNAPPPPQFAQTITIGGQTFLLVPALPTLPRPTANPTLVPSPAPSNSPSTNPSKHPTSTPSASPTDFPSSSPTRYPTKFPSSSPTNFPTKFPTKYPTTSPTKSPSSNPTNFPSLSPTKSPTNFPTNFPSTSPTKTPTKNPTNFPSSSPTNFPSQFPSSTPTSSPSLSPTRYPTISPSLSPTNFPTNFPSKYPSSSPTKTPSRYPSNFPSSSPTNFPTNFPSKYPSSSPTKSPSRFPSKFPSSSPTKTPTKYPTKMPSATPSSSPSLSPTTAKPTSFPSTTPTNYPSSSPTPKPTAFPTSTPSNSPSSTPTKFPSKFPTSTPSSSPTKFPSKFPSNFPSVTPTKNPSQNPTKTPTKFPSQNPTKYPTKFPTTTPTKFPTKFPTQSPTQRPSLNPTTAAPTRYINPYCPPQTVHQTYGTAQINQPGNAIRACLSSYDVVRDFNGELQCDYYGCCLCEQIICGSPGNPCLRVSFGERGAVGNMGVFVDGNPMAMPGVQPLATGNGAMIDCANLESCRAASISSNYISELNCNGQSGCAQSTIQIYNPAHDMRISCNGLYSCYAANIEVHVGFPGQTCVIRQTLRISEISFGGEQAGHSAIITINNRGCDKVLIGTILCANSAACAGTQFVFNGNIEVEDCGVANLGLVPPQLLQCNNQQQSLLCDTMQSCSYQTKIVRNPSPAFMVECLVPNSCAMLDLTIEIDTTLSWISGFTFYAPNSAKGAIFHVINNNIGPLKLRIGDIVCAVPGACNGLTIIVGPTVDILTTNIDCQTPGACNGCLIKDHTGTERPCAAIAAFNAGQAPLGAAPGGIGAVPPVIV